MYFHCYWLICPVPDRAPDSAWIPAEPSGSGALRRSERGGGGDGAFATGCRRGEARRQHRQVQYRDRMSSRCGAEGSEDAGFWPFCEGFWHLSGIRHFWSGTQPERPFLSQFAQGAFVNHFRHRHIRPAIRHLDKRFPMLNRLATFVPLAITVLLTGCAGQVSQNLSGQHQEPSHEELAALSRGYQLPPLADSLLVRGFGLIGTPYRWGGSSLETGFDCSGFIGFLFREEAGIRLPRTTREMITLDAPRVARDELQAGDLIFFNRRGRGQVNHVGVYIGNGRFLHSASRRSGGVRVDSLDNSYWNASYLQAKRALVLATPGDDLLMAPVPAAKSAPTRSAMVLASHED